MRTKIKSLLSKLGWAPDLGTTALAARAIEARHLPVLRALDAELARLDAEIMSCELGAIALIEAEQEQARKQQLRDACQATFARELAEALGDAGTLAFEPARLQQAELAS